MYKLGHQKYYDHEYYKELASLETMGQNRSKNPIRIFSLRLYTICSRFIIYLLLLLSVIQATRAEILTTPCIEYGNGRCNNPSIETLYTSTEDECLSACFRNVLCVWAVSDTLNSWDFSSTRYCQLFDNCNFMDAMSSSLYFCRWEQQCPAGEEPQNNICVRCRSGTFKTNWGSQSCSLCQSCSKGQYRSGCGGSNAGDCVPCDGCPTGQYRSSCGGLNAGSCVNCGSCSSGLERTGCGGQIAGLCTPCKSGYFAS